MLRGHKDIAKSVCVSYACHLFLIKSKGGEDNFIVWDLRKSLKLVFERTCRISLCFDVSSDEISGDLDGRVCLWK